MLAHENILVIPIRLSAAVRAERINVSKNITSNLVIHWAPIPADLTQNISTAEGPNVGISNSSICKSWLNNVTFAMCYYQIAVPISTYQFAFSL